jgi:hypothetical protein
VTAPVTPCDGSADERNAYKTRVVTPVTAVTPFPGNGERQITTSPEDRHPPSDRICVQCNGPEDGKERLVAIGDKTVRLHPECERFYLKAEEWKKLVGPMPDFLDRNRPRVAQPAIAAGDDDLGDVEF